MERKKVESGSIRSVGYDVASGLLEVEFCSGAVYAYKKVPEHEYHRMMRAESIGRAFAYYIRGVYEFERLSTPKPKEGKHEKKAAAAVSADSTAERSRKARIS